MAQTKDIDKRLQQLLAQADMRIAGEMNRSRGKSPLDTMMQEVEARLRENGEILYEKRDEAPLDRMMRETEQRLGQDINTPAKGKGETSYDKIMSEAIDKVKQDTPKQDPSKLDAVLQEANERFGKESDAPANGKGGTTDYDKMMSEAVNKVKQDAKSQIDARLDAMIRENEQKSRQGNVPSLDEAYAKMSKTLDKVMQGTKTPSLEAKRHESDKAQTPDAYGKQPLAAISPRETPRASREVNAFAAVVEARRNERGVTARVDAEKMVRGISNDNLSGPKKILFEWQESYRKEAQRASKGGKRSSGQLVEYDATKRLLDQGYKGTDVLNAFRDNGRSVPPAVYACVKDHKQEERLEGMQVASNRNSFDR